MRAYAELHVLTCFSFRRSVANPQQLVLRAHELGYQGLAITDEVSLAAVVRAHEAAKECGMHLIVGSECHWSEEDLPGALDLIFLVPDSTAYTQLCQLISRARRRGPKGGYQLLPCDLELDLSSLLVIWKPQAQQSISQLNQTAYWLKKRFDHHLWIGVTRWLQAHDQLWSETIKQLGCEHAIPIVACGGILMSHREQKPLLDVMTALERHCRIDECGLNLAANAEAHLRPIETLEKLYPSAWLDESSKIAKQCHFSMSQLSYQYPRELVPQHQTPIEYLRFLTYQGLAQRYGGATPDHVTELIEHELSIIEDMAVEAFFLTVHDLVCYAKSQGILCQGRGSAANSAVCYCLGITEVDPAQQSLLFERFISKERNEPPDIDVDFEHERREEILQYIYQKYGRERAALAATVVTYRPKSALKDVGRALGFDAQLLNQLTRSLAWWDKPDDWPKRLQECGINPSHPKTQWLLKLTQQLIGTPRHLSQHVGGMVISNEPLHKLVPVENAAMADRTIIQWDKDDLETLGLLKVDCLALGMLTVLRKTMQSLDPSMTLSMIPKEDSATYDMLCKADAIGVFQVESRAQMAMLPRLKPRCFYDLVIEIAIVRPGPIQGDMVHPYLKRRQSQEQVNYPNPKLSEVLKRTLGVPIFQEQVMQIAMVAANFSAGQADQLRRAMAAWKRRGGLEPFRETLVEGMLNNGYTQEFAERIYSQIQGFGDYGFPESHAASFALLTYFSAWLKCHHPAAFACALLNSQPMGFYAPAQIIHDVIRHGIEIQPVDINQSEWDCTLIKNNMTNPAIRLGFNQVKGLSAARINKLIKERSIQTFKSIESLAERTGLFKNELSALSKSGAFDSFNRDRRSIHWSTLASRRQGDLLAHTTIQESNNHLEPTPDTQVLFEDYETLGYSLSHHPIAMLRDRLHGPIIRSDQLKKYEHLKNQLVDVLGLVTHRQRPGTASGVIFLSIEDEAGLINIIVWPKVAAQYTKAVLAGQVLRIRGRIQQRDGSLHIIAHSIHANDQELATID